MAPDSVACHRVECLLCVYCSCVICCMFILLCMSLFLLMRFSYQVGQHIDSWTMCLRVMSSFNDFRCFRCVQHVLSITFVPTAALYILTCISTSCFSSGKTVRGADLREILGAEYSPIPPFLLSSSLPSHRSRVLMASGANSQPKSNLVHFSLKI